MSESSNPARRLRFIFSSVLCAALLVPGCAAQRSAAEATSAPESGGVTSLDGESPIPEQPTVSSAGGGGAAPLRTLDEAEAAYAAAQRDLEGLLGGGVSDGLAAEGVQDDERTPKAGQTKPSGEATPLSKGDGRCERVCLALASLERARDAICRITSPEDERCTKASSSVERNRERAQICACPKPKPAEPGSPGPGSTEPEPDEEAGPQD